MPIEVFWTDARIAMLLELKKQGKTGVQIAKHFGVTKNSVAGAVFRSDHPEMFRIKKQRAEERERRRAERKQQSEKNRKERREVREFSSRNERRKSRNIAWTFGTRVGTIRRERNKPGGKDFWETGNDGAGKKLWELGARECPWPLGKFESVAEFFCGAPSENGRTYCSKHCDIAYLSFAPSYLYRHDPDYDPTPLPDYGGSQIYTRFRFQILDKRPR
jgi:GcrA cell cycle regulator